MRHKSFIRKRRRELRRKNGLNRHHLIPVSRSGNNAPENVVVIDKRLHEVIHATWGNRTPKEALQYTSEHFYEVACKIVRALVRQLGVGILERAA